MSTFTYEDNSPLVCVHCDYEVDFDEQEEAFFHVDGEEFTCHTGGTQANIPCMWDPTCSEAGGFPLKEELRDLDDRVIEERYLAFLCQRHLKVVALMTANQPVPFQLLDPFVIEEIPG